MPTVLVPYLEPKADIIDYAGVARVFHATYPITFDHQIRYGNTLGLSWYAPGDFYCFSAYGFWLLGRVIEGATCRGYESFVNELVWKPLEALDSAMGETERKYRQVGEVPYYTKAWPWESDGWTLSVMQSVHLLPGGWNFPELTDYVPYAYRDIRHQDAAGGWVSTAYDLALFMRDLFVHRAVLLGEDTVDFVLLVDRIQRDDDYSHRQALGWRKGYFNMVDYYEQGAIEGSQAFVFNFGNHAGPSPSFVWLFNRNWEGFEYDAPYGYTRYDLNNQIRGVLASLTSWGTEDLFSP